MARIAYSCCGEGRGHSSRTFTIAQRLSSEGHEVRLYASHAAYAALSPLIDGVTEIPGLTLEYHNNRVQVGQTLARNFKTWRRRGPAVAKLKRDVSTFKPHLIVTDFEPFLPGVARDFNLPFISVDHQHVIPGLRLRPPRKYWLHYLATLAVVRLTHSGEAANLITSFFRPERPFAGHYHYFGPILREAITSVRPANDGHVLVYQTSSSFSSLPNILQRVPLAFRVYAYAREGAVGNCIFKPRNHPDFVSDLLTCDWVLTNGGYTLISEALALGKPVLSVPIEGQFEQWINSHHLQKLGYGSHCEKSDLNAEHIEEFHARRDLYKVRISSENFNGTEAVLNKIRSFL